MAEESNQVKWIGIRPPSEQAIFQHEPGPWSAVRGGVTRTQVFQVNEGNANTVTIYQVTNGKTLYLTHAYISGAQPASQVVDLLVSTSADVLVFYFGRFNWLSTADKIFAFNYSMPIVVPSQYKVRLTVGGANYIRAGIHGWEE